MESILTSIKKLLGPTENDEYFDPDIIMFVNSVFFDLHQLGVGPPEGFMIEDDTAEWSDFTSDFLVQNAVKDYIFHKVKLKFDPNEPSAVIKSRESIIKELEWRLNISAESTPTY